MTAHIMRAILYCLTILITGVRSRGDLAEHECGGGQRIFYANHQSHGDFLLIWAALPGKMRRRVRPVAAGDYWLKTPVRRWLARQVFNMVLIARDGGPVQAQQTIAAALQQGDDLILFPEGTRRTGDTLLPFKSGLFYLHLQHPEVHLVPVWIENIQDVLPKGRYLPVPMLCSVCFGVNFRPQTADKSAFLQQARQQLLVLRDER